MLEIGYQQDLLNVGKSVKDRFEKLTPFLNERQKRLMAATEAKSIGYGGISTVARSTGLSRATIAKGCRELETAVGSLGELITGILPEMSINNWC